MRTDFLCLALSLCLGLAFPASAAPRSPKADTAPPRTAKQTGKKKKNAGKLSPVAAALKDLPYITEARPNLKAKEYRYMQSATWCRFCNYKMPGLVEGYADMKKRGIEIILISADATEEQARAFMEKYKAPFPCVMRTAEGVDKLPQFVNSGGHLPSVYTVAADGTLISDGSPMKGRPD